MNEPLVTISYKEYQLLLEAKKFHAIFFKNLGTLLDFHNDLDESDPYRYYTSASLVTPDDADKFVRDFTDGKYEFESKDGLKEFVVKLKDEANN